MPKQFDYLNYLKASTAASGVPLKVSDKKVVRSIAAAIIR